MTDDLLEWLKTMPAHRIPPPRGYVTRNDVDPRLLDGLEAHGYDPADYLCRLNESTHRRRQATVLAEAEEIMRW